jgi:predicted nucleotidyltransferase
MNAPLSVILADLRSRLEGLCGARLHRLILFGSQARGDGDSESDIDVLVVLTDESAIASHRTGVTDIVHQLCLRYDTLISCVFTTADRAELSGLPFYRNVRREGVPL